MSTLLTNLENSDAVLLMYLANELPAEDRAEVESMLEHDAGLRQQYESLRSAYAAVDVAIGQADASSHLNSGFSAARAFGDEVRHRIKARASVDDKDDHSRRIALWWYPVAAAALVALGMLLWWRNASMSEQGPTLAQTPYIEMWQPDDADQETLTLFDPPASNPVEDELNAQLDMVAYLRSGEAFW